MNDVSTHLPAHITKLHDLDQAWSLRSAGERFEAVMQNAPRLKERIVASGNVACVRTFDVSDAPYPTRFAFAGLASSPVPFIVFTNRTNLVQVETDEGLKTLMFNPTD